MENSPAKQYVLKLISVKNFNLEKGPVAGCKMCNFVFIPMQY